MQHEQIGDMAYSVNKYGVTIEHSHWRPSKLEEGRCCGRKTHLYKKALVAGPGSCCFKCNREYDLTGDQRPNSRYKRDADGNYCRDRPMTLEESSAL